jgi:hypothetical protein
MGHKLGLIGKQGALHVAFSLKADPVEMPAGFEVPFESWSCGESRVTLSTEVWGSVPVILVEEAFLDGFKGEAVAARVRTSK